MRLFIECAVFALIVFSCEKQSRNKNSPVSSNSIEEDVVRGSTSDSLEVFLSNFNGDVLNSEWKTLNLFDKIRKIGAEPHLILYIPSNACDPCLEYEMKSIKNKFNLDESNIIFLTDCGNSRELAVFIERFTIPKSKTFSLIVQDSHNIEFIGYDYGPLYFILPSSGKMEFFSKSVKYDFTFIESRLDELY